MPIINILIFFCAEYNLIIPISRSKRLPQNPIDNIGIKPDILIDNDEKQKIFNQIAVGKMIFVLIDYNC